MNQEQKLEVTGKTPVKPAADRKCPQIYFLFDLQTEARRFVRLCLPVWVGTSHTGEKPADFIVKCFTGTWWTLGTLGTLGTSFI